jgi:chromosome segregation ATPase
MALFSGKVVSAKFIDPPNNMLIEVLYREGDMMTPYVLEVDFTQQDFVDLLKEITLEEIQSNTKSQLEAQRKEIFSSIDAEIERRWEAESQKIKEAYDKVESYAKEIIEKEYNKIESAWEEVRKESDKIDSAWNQIKSEYEKVEGSWREIEKESAKVESTWKEIEKESAKVESSWKEIEKESAKVESSWKEIKNEYQKVDTYAELEKEKKMEEVQSEFQKLRKELSSKFSTGQISTKLGPKDIFQQLFNSDQDQDFVFNLKISILEDPDIAKSKDKDLKLSIRKAKSVTELLNIYCAKKVA